MMKKILTGIVLIAAIIFFCGQNNLTEARRAAHTWATVINCNEWISLRSEPSVYAERLAKVPLGTRLKIYYEGEPKNGFYYAYYSDVGRYGEYGWVLASYLSFD